MDTALLAFPSGARARDPRPGSGRPKSSRLASSLEQCPLACVYLCVCEYCVRVCVWRLCGCVCVCVCACMCVCVCVCVCV